ncbi:MAG: DUF3016 domain-containing protein [Psychrobium sp.]
MKKLMLASVLGLCSLAAQASESNVSVEFVQSERYQDINASGNQNQARYQERLFKTLEKQFQESANDLPNGMTLDVKVLDIDLAGSVAMGLGMGQDIRQVSDKDFPRILFYVVLKDQNGKILLQGKQNLRDANLRHNEFRLRGSQSDFYMETAIVKKWFDGALIPAVAKL